MNPDPVTTTFLNVDLDLRCAAGLDDLLAALASRAIVLHRTENTASLEADQDSETLDAAVTRLLDLVAALPPAARAVWDRCEARVFNIGLRAGVSPHAAGFGLTERAVQRLAAVGAGIEITIYA